MEDTRRLHGWGMMKSLATAFYIHEEQNRIIHLKSYIARTSNGHRRWLINGVKYVTIQENPHAVLEHAITRFPASTSSAGWTGDGHYLPPSPLF